MNVKETVFKKLKALTKKQFDENSDIYSVGIDSLDLVEMVTEAEDELNVQISDDDLESIKTVKDVIDAFERAVK